jgi:hypothetical protein
MSTANDPATPAFVTRRQLLEEAVEMLRYASSVGIAVPAPVVQTVDAFETAGSETPGLDLRPLVSAHGRLVKLVAPAAPGTLVFIARTRDTVPRFARWLGPVPLVRRMAAAALVSLGVFILLSIAHGIDRASAALDFTETTGGALLLNELFWLASAGIGASFAMLFQVHEFIVKRNYDPAHEPSYWIKFMLGVVAGFILVAVLFPAGADTETAATTAGAFSRPLLAMLGGFSASLVHRILTRLVDTVEGLFRGDPRDAAAVRESAATARAAEEAGQARLAVAGKLVELQNRVAGGAAADDLSGEISAVIASLVPDASGADLLPPAAPAARDDDAEGDEAEAPAAGRAGSVQVGAVVG